MDLPEKSKRPPRGIPIAIESETTIRVMTTVALGQLSITPFSAERPGEPLKAEMLPVQHAYVLCMQLTAGGYRLPRPLIRWGRTNDRGWIIECEEAELDRAPPAAAFTKPEYHPAPNGYSLGSWSFGEPEFTSDHLSLVMMEGYKLFWSYDPVRFKHASAALKLNPHGEPEGVASKQVTFQQQDERPEEELASLDPHTRRIIEQCILRSETSGYLVGSQQSYSVCLFDVTPTILRRFYLCEFLLWWAVKLEQDSGAHKAALLRGANLVDIAYHGLPEAYLERAFTTQEGSPEREVFEMYRDYVWQCAANGIPREQLEPSIDIPALSFAESRPDWKVAADKIGRATQRKVTHPAFRGVESGLLILNGFTKQLLLEYYSMYVFGHRLRGSGETPNIANRFANASAGHDRELANHRLFIHRILSARVPFVELVEALNFGPSDQAVQRLDLSIRYIDLCSHVSLEWWQEMETYEDEAWKSVKVRNEWVTKLAGGAGELLRNFFEKRLRSYNLSLDRANQALTQLARYHAALEGELDGAFFKQSLPKGRSLVRVDYHESTITVINAFDGTTELAKPLKLTFTAADGERLPTVRRASGPRRPLTASELARLKLPVEVQTPVDIQRAQRLGAKLPPSLALACGTLNTFFGTMATLKELQQGITELQKGGGVSRKNVEAWYELGKNVLGVVDSMASLHDAMAPQIDGYSPLLRQLTPRITGLVRSVGVIDGAYNVYTGIELLSSEDGAAQYELRQGRSVRGRVLQAKGCLQIATGAAGGYIAGASLVTAGGATATGIIGIATGPIGLAVAIGGLLVLCIDVGIELTQEFEPQTTAFELALEEAERKELPLDERQFLATRRLVAMRNISLSAVGRTPGDPDFRKFD